MDLSTKVNLVLCILSLILSAISVVTVIITLRQNSKMIEASTRPYLCVYGESINTGNPQFYLVIKNFGASPAVITRFDFAPDLSKSYGLSNPKRNYLKDLAKSTLAPGQARICRLDYSLVPDEVLFDIEYRFGRKIYSEHFTTNIKSGTSMPTIKTATSDRELRTISYTLQEMLQKNL